MQQFSFKSGNASVRHLKELPQPKKKINTDRVLFLALLAVTIIYVLFQLYQRLAIIEIDGMVTMNKLSVNFSNDVRIVNLGIEEGSAVQEGDTLFAYINQYFENDAALFTSYTSNIERLTREQLSLRRELSEKKTALNLLLQQIKEEEQELEKTKELVVLAAYSRSTYDADKKSFQQSRQKALLLDEEIRLLNNHIRELDQMKNDYAPSKTMENKTITRYYMAPFDGMIGRIQVEENEICYKATDVLAIHKPEQVRVQAYFRQEVIDYINIGDTVSIQFPDGNVQEGVISKYYISTYELPSEFQKKYEPTERGILVDIVPSDPTEVSGWNQFYKMTVKVSLNRFF